MMDETTKQFLRQLRLKLQDRAQKEFDHSRTIHPGSPRREKQVGISIGLERAVKLIEEELIAA